MQLKSFALSAFTGLMLLLTGWASPTISRAQSVVQPSGAMAPNPPPGTPVYAGGPSAPSFQFSSQERGLGPEYQISTSTNPETDRYYPVAAYDTRHHQTLVVWDRKGGGSYYIEGRLIGADGHPLGVGPTVFASGQTPVYRPVAVYDANDDQYLVVWMRNTLLDGSTYAIWGKELSASLAEVHPEFLIFNPPEGYTCWSPRATFNPGPGEYLVAWNVYSFVNYPNKSDIAPENISLAVVAWTGKTLFSTRVIGNGPGNMVYPDEVDIVYANNGGANNWGQYLWVWLQQNPSTGEFDVWGANIDAWTSGVTPGVPPFAIDTSTVEHAVEHTNPHIATNGANRFLVVWQERSSTAPSDWDVRGREINQIGNTLGDLHIIAGYGSTDETVPFVAAWPGSTNEYVVGYARQSARGQDIYLSYFNNDLNVLHSSGYAFWLDVFPVASYGFWINSYPAGVVTGAGVLITYDGVSSIPGDHPQIFSRTWSPVLVYVPFVKR